MNGMTKTLEEIHRDPAIRDRAISSEEALDITLQGKVAATLFPLRRFAVVAARLLMKERFAAPDWEFSGGASLTRDKRNARG